MVFLVVSVALLVQRGHDSSAYRNGAAPARHGVVTSGPEPRRLTCGRGAKGYQVEVSYSVAGRVHTEPLPTCHPARYPRGTFVITWEKRPGELTLAPPSRSTHLLWVALGVLSLIWLALSLLFLSRMRAQRR
jgi:hypothetical protein